MYEGQIAGLVKPGTNDIHIRFYHDRLFAEIEISRAYISHFYGPKYNARELVLDLLRSKLRNHEYRFLERQLRSNAIRIEEAELPICAKDTPSFELPFETVSSLKSDTVLQTIMKWSVSTHWLHVGLCIIVILVLAFARSLSPSYLLAAIIGSVTSLYIIAPKTPRSR